VSIEERRLYFTSHSLLLERREDAQDVTDVLGEAERHEASEATPDDERENPDEHRMPTVEESAAGDPGASMQPDPSRAAACTPSVEASNQVRRAVATVRW
jgi:hypothetical protein